MVEIQSSEAKLDSDVVSRTHNWRGNWRLPNYRLGAIHLLSYAVPLLYSCL